MLPLVAANNPTGCGFIDPVASSDRCAGFAVRCRHTDRGDRFLGELRASAALSVRSFLRLRVPTMMLASGNALGFGFRTTALSTRGELGMQPKRMCLSSRKRLGVKTTATAVTAGLSSLRDHVGRVVGGCTGHQMGGIATWRVIALDMPDQETIGNRANAELVGDTMRAPAAVSTVAIFILWPKERPTRRRSSGSVNTCPKIAIVFHVRSPLCRVALRGWDAVRGSALSTVHDAVRVLSNCSSAQAKEGCS